MEETVDGLNPKNRERKTSMTITDTDEAEGYYHLNASRHNIMYTFFYSNVSKFGGDL